MQNLSDEEINKFLESLEGWYREGKSIRKKFKTKGFPQTMGLVTAIGSFCQQHDHHPDYLTMKYSDVELSFSTHVTGGVSMKDINIAKDINTLTF